MVSFAFAVYLRARNFLVLREHLFLRNLFIESASKYVSLYYVCLNLGAPLQWESL